MSNPKRLGEILVDLGVITRAEAEFVAAAQSRRGDTVKFGKLAKDLGLVTAEQVLAALAVQLELVPANLQRSIHKVIGDLRGPGPKSPLPILMKPTQGRVAKRGK